MTLLYKCPNFAVKMGNKTEIPESRNVKNRLEVTGNGSVMTESAKDRTKLLVGIDQRGLKMDWK